MKSLRMLLTSIFLFTGAVCLAQEGTSLSSDWIEFVKGADEPTLGVQVRDIQPGELEGTRTVTFAVPKDSVSHPDDIEEVIVVGQKPDAPEKPEPLDIQYKWLHDYDNDNYGLVITLGEGNWPIRLFVNSRPGYIN